MRFLPLFPAPDARTLFCVRAIIHKCKLTLSLVLLLLMVPLLSAAQQPPTGQDLDRAHVILRTIKDDLKTFDQTMGLPDPPSFRIIQPAGDVAP